MLIFDMHLVLLMHNYCPECGKDLLALEETAKFCPYCGYDLIQKEKTQGKKSDGEIQKQVPVEHSESNYLSILDDISGSLKAILLDEEDNVIAKIPVRELTYEIKRIYGISTIIFDGVVTQRLVDIAASRNIGTIVCIKMGNVVKKPDTIRFITQKKIRK